MEKKLEMDPILDLQEDLTNQESMEKTLTILDILAKYHAIMETEERVKADDFEEEEEEAENELEERNLFHRRKEIIVPAIDDTQSRELDSDNDLEDEITVITEPKEKEADYIHKTLRKVHNFSRERNEEKRKGCREKTKNLKFPA
jgi:hypothetical protein